MLREYTMARIKFQRLSIITIFLGTTLLLSGNACAIAKCQDAEGNWHYGDSAASACGVTKITILNDKGRKTDEIGVPLTDEELRAEEVEAERLELEKKQADKRALEKARILAVYPDVESIIRSRDQRLNGMERIIVLQQKLLDAMRLDMKKFEAREIPKDKKALKKYQAQKLDLQEGVDDYYSAISKLRREREQAAEKYKKTLIEYKEITGLE